MGGRQRSPIAGVSPRALATAVVVSRGGMIRLAGLIGMRSFASWCEARGVWMRTASTRRLSPVDVGGLQVGEPDRPGLFLLRVDCLPGDVVHRSVLAMRSR